MASAGRPTGLLETTTRIGSRVLIDYVDDKYVYGRWFDGVSQWYPNRWTLNGKHWSDDAPNLSLDITWPISQLSDV